MKIVGIVVIVGAILLTGCAGQQVKKQLDDHMALSIDEMKDKIEVKYDIKYDNTAIISTRPVWQITGGLLNVPQSDYFLRGFVDMKTGATTYQVYNWIWYTTEASWHHYFSVSIPLNGRVIDKDLNRIGTDVDCTGSRYGGCTHYETVTFEFTAEEWVEIRQRAPQKLNDAMVYKMRGKSGNDHEGAITAKEILAFDKKLNEFKRQHGLNN